MKLARELGVRVIYNPAPYDNNIAKEACALSDVLILNETEAAELANQKQVDSDEDCIRASRTILALGPKIVILTRGANGCVAVSR